MKTKIFTVAVIAVLFLCAALPSRAQYYDEKPELPLKGKFYSEVSLPGDHKSSRSINPLISGIISQISADTIRATLQHMQDYGTRFMLSENRKEIAEWLMQKFISFGYTDVKLDSFLNILNWNNIFIDTTWQYNVVCTIQGASAPDEIYVVGGHYDSFCYGDPYAIAPGTNDNATAVAATLEIARVLKANNYQPEATIRFSPFAAEELGLWGSRYAAETDRVTGNDVRFMLNMDMISNDPDSTNIVKIFRYYYVEWAGYLAADVFERYTNLDIYLPDNLAASGSDSFPYWMYGFPVMYLEEMDFSPHWHQLSDTLGNCNVGYCAEVARGACATLLEQQFLPYPQGFAAASGTDGVNLTWKPTANAKLLGYNIYRSGTPGTGYVKLTPTPVPDSFYMDQSVIAGKEYYYVMNLVNDSLQESMTSNEVFGAKFDFGDSLLVVASLKDTQTTPDSIYQFYAAILDSIPFRWVDINEEEFLDLGILSRYRNMLWLMNSPQYELLDEPTAIRLISYFANGGNVMMAGFLPSDMLAHNGSYPMTFGSNYFITAYFKIFGVDREMISLMYQAYPDMAGYDTLRVDSLKQMSPNFPGELYNIETLTPAAEAAVTFRFDSRYDSTTNYGASQGRAVGIEYMGNDYKTIVLSFPLYYLDRADARKLMKYVMTEKFSHPTGIPDPTAIKENLSLVIYPNPATGSFTCSWYLDEPSPVILKLYDLQGREIRTLLNAKKDRGVHTVRFDAGNLPQGIYQVVLTTGGSVAVKKVVLIR
jgi:hypothetical protein